MRKRINEKYLLYILKIQPLMAAHIFYGRAMFWIKHQQHAMLFFMVIKPLTVRPAEQELLHEWRNGMQKVN